MVMSLVVAAGAATAVTGHDHGLGQLAVDAAAVAGNMVATDVHSALTRPPSGDHDLLRNHDLTVAVGKTIAAVISKSATEMSSGTKQRIALDRMAESAPERWLNLSASQDPDFTDIAESNLPELLSVHAGDIAHVRTLEIETWKSLLNVLDSERNLTAPTINSLASQLHEGFAQALFEILKADFAAGGKAFPALALLLLGETNAIVKEMATDVKILLDRTQEQPRLLSDLPVSGQHEIPRRNLRFTGRAEILEELVVALRPGEPVALTGTPGIGKTETATEFIYRFCPDKKRVYWVNADTPALPVAFASRWT
jgi:ABC-type glutathione transport system ATPase component